MTSPTFSEAVERTLALLHSVAVHERTLATLFIVVALVLVCVLVVFFVWPLARRLYAVAAALVDMFGFAFKLVVIVGALRAYVVPYLPPVWIEGARHGVKVAVGALPEWVQSVVAPWVL
jgi:hypothetical protein